VRAMAVAPAMMWQCDELLYVMYLCCKMNMYCCEHYVLSLIYMSKLELSFYCFGCSPSG
jgi:hypothetical protein